MNHSLLLDESILIVDDEAANLKLMRLILSAQGYRRLHTISDAREVQSFVRQSPTSLILLDINMPYLSGFEVLEQLQSLSHSPPVIMLTAQTDRDFLLRALSLGARDYITKPFDQQELVMRVRNLLEAQFGVRLLHNQKAVLETLVQQRTEELRQTRLEVVYRLGLAAEFRDEETGEHIVRMSRSCQLIATALGWSEAEAELLLHASPMHDIGKLGIPDRVLLKPGKLNADEWEIMKSHTVIGARLLAGNESSLMQMAERIALSHHEKWDGSGYPHGLAGEDIPEEGRIVAVADVFDALTSTRPYKGAWPMDEALDYIRSRAGEQFSPEVVVAFEQVLPEIMAIRAQYPDQISPPGSDAGQPAFPADQ